MEKPHGLSLPGPVRAPGWKAIEGGASCSPARWWGGECESQAARHARFVSADLDQARIGHPRSQVCETCGGTAPCPASATPRERAPRRARMSLAIAQLRAEVKNKVRTCSLLSLSLVRERVPCAAGWERGCACSDVPSPGSLSFATLPRQGGREDSRHILHPIPDLASLVRDNSPKEKGPFGPFATFQNLKPIRPKPESSG